MNVVEFGEPKWITDSKGNHIAIYEGLTVEESIEVKKHYKEIQSMVDTYPKRYHTGRNLQIIDDYVYNFDVSKKGRKVKLLNRHRYGEGDFDV